MKKCIVFACLFCTMNNAQTLASGTSKHTAITYASSIEKTVNRQYEGYCAIQNGEDTLGIKVDLNIIHQKDKNGTVNPANSINSSIVFVPKVYHFGHTLTFLPLAKAVYCSSPDRMLWFMRRR